MLERHNVICSLILLNSSWSSSSDLFNAAMLEWCWWAGTSNMSRACTMWRRKRWSKLFRLLSDWPMHLWVSSMMVFSFIPSSCSSLSITSEAFFTCSRLGGSVNKIMKDEEKHFYFRIDYFVFISLFQETSGERKLTLNFQTR